MKLRRLSADDCATAGSVSAHAATHAESAKRIARFAFFDPTDMDV
jgi:hypothetical protein